MKVTVISANLGSYDKPNDWPELIAPPGVTVDVHRLTDANFPPRPLAMTSRLQCGIPKWFGVDFAPSADVIVWIDASCAPTPIAVSWFLEKLGTADIAVFTHPDRKTVREEYEFMTRKLAEGNRYLTSRYQGEWLAEMYERIGVMAASKLRLFASTAFVYRVTGDGHDEEARNCRVIKALADVFLWKARYLLHDQLALSWVLHQHQIKVKVIPDNYLKCPALEYVRNKRS